MSRRAADPQIMILCRCSIFRSKPCFLDKELSGNHSHGATCRLPPVTTSPSQLLSTGFEVSSDQQRFLRRDGRKMRKVKRFKENGDTVGLSGAGRRVYKCTQRYLSCLANHNSPLKCPRPNEDVSLAGLYLFLQPLRLSRGF